jgi:hypothetical protein
MLRNALMQIECATHQSAVREQLLLDDVARGRERVRIPLVSDTAADVAPPDFTYRPDYTASLPAALMINELYRLKLIQWAGAARTDADDGGDLTARFSGPAAVFFNSHLQLEKIQFTPCMEDAPGAPGPLRRCCSASVTSAYCAPRPKTAYSAVMCRLVYSYTPSPWHAADLWRQLRCSACA